MPPQLQQNDAKGGSRHHVRKGTGETRERVLRDKDRTLRRQGARPLAPVQGVVRVRREIQGMAVRVRPNAIQVLFQITGSAEGLAVAGVRKVQAPPGNGVTPTSDLECAAGLLKPLGSKKTTMKSADV